MAGPRRFADGHAVAQWPDAGSSGLGRAGGRVDYLRDFVALPRRDGPVEPVALAPRGAED